MCPLTNSSMKVSHGSSDEQTVVSVFTHVYRSRIRTPGTRVGCGVVSYLYSAQLRLFSVCVRMVGEGTAAPPTGAAMSLGFRFVLSYIYICIHSLQMSSNIRQCTAVRTFSS